MAEELNDLVRTFGLPGAILVMVIVAIWMKWFVPGWYVEQVEENLNAEIQLQRAKAKTRSISADGSESLEARLKFTEDFFKDLYAGLKLERREPSDASGDAHGSGVADPARSKRVARPKKGPPAS
jgi:hypothetical protein